MENRAVNTTKMSFFLPIENTDFQSPNCMFVIYDCYYLFNLIFFY